MKKIFPSFLYLISGTFFTLMACGLLATPTVPPFQSTEAPIPTKTIAAPTETNIPPTLSFIPEMGSTLVGKDGMTLIFVPEGNFIMGGNDKSEQKPIHTVYLDSFWIDQTEVTNKQYAACVSDRGCSIPANISSSTRANYYGNSEFDNFPVIYVNWHQAKAYCLWAGRDLPTEAQWEKAARGTDGRLYPWGDDIDKSRYNMYGDDTNTVGNYEMGKSKYGVYDMAGNVQEWVKDIFQWDYYTTLGENTSNPQGPSMVPAGDFEVRGLRGGSWADSEFTVRSAHRYQMWPDNSHFTIGFRCAQSFP